MKLQPLSRLLQLPSKPLISIVGAGGKTTTMYTLAAEFAGQGKRVVTTTTTNIYLPQPGETDTLIVAAETPTLLQMTKAAWEKYQHVTVAGRMVGAGKLGGVQLDQPYELLQRGGADVVIVEADGARHSMIKAPAEYEPVIPAQTTIALIVLSAEAINQPLNGEIAHRPERIAALLDINQGELLTPELIARLLTHELGGLKNIPAQAGVYVLITHVARSNLVAILELASLVRGFPRITGMYGSESPGEWLVLGK